MIVNDKNFIAQLRKKNESALEFVVKEYGGLINSIVKKHLYNLESYQEECIDDVFLGVWANINRFDESKNSFKNWIAAIAKYKTIDYRRKYLKEIHNKSINEMDLPSEDTGIEHIINKELNSELDALLKHLKPTDKELFLSLYYRDEDINDVSIATGLKKSTIYNRLSRGKKKLRLISKTNMR